MDDWRERITINPTVLAGKPTVRGMRLGVEMILEQLAMGWSQDDILKAYPVLTPDDIRACLAYAVAVLEKQSKPLAV